jgi:hypothetical protein
LDAVVQFQLLSCATQTRSITPRATMSIDEKLMSMTPAAPGKTNGVEVDTGPT